MAQVHTLYPVPNPGQSPGRYTHVARPTLEQQLKMSLNRTPPVVVVMLPTDSVLEDLHADLGLIVEGFRP